MGESTRDKAAGIYSYIGENLYFNRPDLRLGGKGYNSALLFALLTGLTGGNELIIGEPGLGKTSSAEYVASILYQLPLEVVWSAEVHGHPEQTEEKIVGRPDLGRLNKGEEKTIWSYFTQLSVKIVDEINRLPETKQSSILDGVDRGNWKYLNEMVMVEDQCLYATANYQDRGTNELLPPMCDRLDVVVESKHPGANRAMKIALKGKEGLRSPQDAARFEKILGSKVPYGKKLPEMERASAAFGKHLSGMGLEPISKEERKEAKEEMKGVAFDMDASGFTRTLVSELSFCLIYGQKRTNETCKEGCPFSEYLCHRVRNCASNRLPVSISRYARALAWFLGEDKVTVEHVKVIAPHAMAHRVRWRDEFVSAHETDRRMDPLQIHLARVAVEEVLNRYRVLGEEIKAAFHASSKGQAAELPLGKHPIFHEIQRDIGQQIGYGQ